MQPPGSRSAFRRVQVGVGDHPYDVHVGAGVLDQLGAIVGEACGGSPRVCMLVRDIGVASERTDEARRSLEAGGSTVVECVARAGEQHKTLMEAEGMLRGFAHARLDRDDVVVVLGGGVVGDLAGFAASVYRRGLRVIQCPTTLLAMVDASVGGKTGVNLDLGEGVITKNMIGTFHHPGAVAADVRTLSTLDDREFRAGLGECLKHAMIAGDTGDEALGTWTDGALERVIARDERVLVELVDRNIRVKARIVEGDPEENAAEGGRALLNLGHTFGHVIETMEGVETVGCGPGILHGEGVALGLVAAVASAVYLGRVPPDQIDAVRRRVRAAGLADRARGLASPDQLIDAMGMDKKVRGGVLRVVLPCGATRAGVVSRPDRGALEAGWAAIRAE